MTVAGYNRRHRMKSLWLKARVSACLACMGLLLAWTSVCRAAEPWDAQVAELAHQIAALTGPGAVSLSIRNNSSIPADEIPAIRRSLLTALSALGVTARPEQDAATIVRVTLSQNARQGLWVAEVQQGPEVRVAMVSVANLAPALPPQGTPVLLRKTLLFSQAEPILDAQLIPLTAAGPDVRSLVVLSPEQIAIYHGGQNGGPWVKDQSFEVAHDRPYPRDVRGRLQKDVGGLFKAYLPGVVCSASQQTAVAGTSISVACADNDDPWPIGSRKAFYNSSRDYFTGVIIPYLGGDSQPYYSAAELLGKRGAATVYSEVGGQFRISDGAGLKALVGSRDWGSDLVGVQSDCGAGAQLLATASGDVMQDSLLAYEVGGNDAIAVSPPLPLGGQVTALWPADGPATAVMILKREQPLQYEAYSVSLVCNP
jgi:hypothetical protein